MFFLLNTFVFLWKRLGRSRSSTSHKRNSVNSFRPRVESLFVFARYHTFSPENVCLHVETRATDKAAHRYYAVVVVAAVGVVVVGCWLLLVVVGCWSLLVVVGCWLSDVVGCCWLLVVVGCWLLLVVGCCWKQTFVKNSFLFCFSPYGRKMCVYMLKLVQLTRQLIATVLLLLLLLLLLFLLLLLLLVVVVVSCWLLVVVGCWLLVVLGCCCWLLVVVGCCWLLVVVGCWLLLHFMGFPQHQIKPSLSFACRAFGSGHWIAPCLSSAAVCFHLLCG